MSGHQMLPTHMSPRGYTSCQLTMNPRPMEIRFGTLTHVRATLYVNCGHRKGQQVWGRSGRGLVGGRLSRLWLASLWSGKGGSGA